MKKVLLVLALGALMFSCAKDEVSTSKNEGKSTMGIVDPGDPDMNCNCGGTVTPLSQMYTSDQRYDVKAYFVRNDTKYTIRGSLYLMPKFTANATTDNVFGNIPDLYLIQDFLIDPGYCKQFIAGNLTQNPDRFVFENGDQFFGNKHNTVNNYHNGIILNDKYKYFSEYHSDSNSAWDNVLPTSFSIVNSSNKPGGTAWIMLFYKLAFMKFILIDEYGNESDEHIVSVENWDDQYKYGTSSSLIDYFSNASMFTSNITTKPWDLPAPQYFTLPLEVPNTSVAKAIYYTLQDVYYKTTDHSFGVTGSLRHMPFVVNQNDPIDNPDTSPGYIISFEYY
ncbi:MAG: hypothetical protein LBE34_12625 [Flavobacteriaceae bacterium]|jgi:hypothetical protein|nr:hypothetical protein [Flavobacteriaceae bacterium]